MKKINVIAGHVGNTSYTDSAAKMCTLFSIGELNTITHSTAFIIILPIMLLLNVSAPKHLNNLFTSYSCHLLKTVVQ
jgi:hypothetical protein